MVIGLDGKKCCTIGTKWWCVCEKEEVGVLKGIDV
jgi:hypothetical protein